ncbi:MAG: hypothetical protein ACTSVF_05165 [Candidatus Asgardarchaeia archaeon]
MEGGKRDAIRFLTSSLIVLMSSIGIILTLGIYFLVSPSLGEMRETNTQVADVMMDVVSVTSEASNNINILEEAYETRRMSTIRALTSIRDILDGCECGGDKEALLDTVDYSISELNVSLTVSQKTLDPGLTQDILEWRAREESIINTFNLMFTGWTIITVMMFLSFIILSILPLVRI